jgi:hypothetical protein
VGESYCQDLRSSRADELAVHRSTGARFGELEFLTKNMEHFFTCPHCFERISMVLDTSVKRQTYVEDCEVCCHPIEISYTVVNDEVRSFEARPI